MQQSLVRDRTLVLLKAAVVDCVFSILEVILGLKSSCVGTRHRNRDLDSKKVGRCLDGDACQNCLDYWWNTIGGNVYSF